jgi:hypothetical protein
MISCSAGGMAWSAMPMTDQEGMVSHAGVPEGAFAALNASGRWVAARTAASLAGRPLAKHWAKPGYGRSGAVLCQAGQGRLVVIVFPIARASFISFLSAVLA